MLGKKARSWKLWSHLNSKLAALLCWHPELQLPFNLPITHRRSKYWVLQLAVPPLLPAPGPFCSG